MAVRASKKPVGSAQAFSILIIHTANSTKYKLTKTLLCYNQSLFTTRLQWLDILDCLRFRIKFIKNYICSWLKFLLLYFRFCFYFKLSLDEIGLFLSLLCDETVHLSPWLRSNFNVWLSKCLKCHSIIYKGKCAAKRLQLKENCFSSLVFIPRLLLLRVCAISWNSTTVVK